MRDFSQTIVAGLALAAAIGSGYVAVATRTTQAQVEHLIELKSTDKFSEVLRRLESIDRRLDRLEHRE